MSQPPFIPHAIFSHINKVPKAPRVVYGAKKRIMHGYINTQAGVAPEKNLSHSFSSQNENFIHISSHIDLSTSESSTKLSLCFYCKERIGDQKDCPIMHIITIFKGIF